MPSSKSSIEPLVILNEEIAILDEIVRIANNPNVTSIASSRKTELVAVKEANLIRTRRRSDASVASNVSTSSVSSLASLSHDQKFSYYQQILLSSDRNSELLADERQKIMKNLCSERFTDLVSIFSAKFLAEDEEAAKQECLTGLFLAFANPENFAEVDQCDRQQMLVWLYKDYRIEEFLSAQTGKMMIHHSLAYNDLITAQHLYKIYSRETKIQAFDFVDKYGDGIFHFAANGIILQENSCLTADEKVISFVLNCFGELATPNQSLSDKLTIMRELLEDEIYITDVIGSELSKQPVSSVC